MRDLFLAVLSMSLTAAPVILVVLLARLALRRAPKVFSYALWAVVLLRLLCPFSIPSPWSVTPTVRVEPVQEDYVMVALTMERMELSIRVDDAPVGRAQAAGPLDGPGSASPAAGGGPGRLTIAGFIWLAGAVLLLGRSIASLLLLRRRLVGAAPLEGEEGVFLADHIPSPFVLGLFRPKIYLPSDLPEGERDYILLHERTHIRRFDHALRALSWLAVAVHWFNPLVWLSFRLAGKDMEMSCDEAVLKRMDRDVRADYSSSLLRLSAGKRLPGGPLAFGELEPEGRIRNVLRYRKPALWVVAAALAGVLAVGLGLATSRACTLDPPGPGEASLPPLDAAAGLELAPDSVERTGDPIIRISGTADGVALSRAIWWSPGSLELLYGEHPGGVLSMEYEFSSGRAIVGAWWTDEKRTSITVDTRESAMVSSYMFSGYWIFTVDLSDGRGAVTSMGTGNSEHTIDARVKMCPESISDEEAVRVARAAAKVLALVEEYNSSAPAAGAS